MRKNNAVTLLELIIAISLLTLIVFAAGGIYLSGWRMSRDARFQAQAERNAMIPMMHMVKHLSEKAGNPKMVVGPGYIPPPPFTTIYFNVYNDPPDFDNPPSGFDSYQWDGDRHQIFFNTSVIGSHIFYARFEPSHFGAIYNITITARDNNDSEDSEYTLNSSVEARYEQVPSVY